MNKDYKLATFKDGDFSIDIKISLDEETIWASASELALIFDKEISVINKHIKQIILSESFNESMCANYAYMLSNKRKYQSKIYNLEFINLLSYKVRSKRAPIFISWVKETIQELKQNQLIEINDSYNNLLHSNKYEFVKFKDRNKVIDVKVSIDEQTVWLSQDQIALLYGKSISTINEHINNIFKEGELDRNSSFGISEFTPNGKKIMVYNLDVILYVGYRVKSKQGILFRKWVTEQIKRILIERAKNYYASLPVNQILEIKEELQEISNTVTVLNQKYIDDNNKLFLIKNGYDAYALLTKIINQAEHNIIIVDSYIDNSIIPYLNAIKENVDCKLITSGQNKLSEEDKLHIKEYFKNITLYISDDFHDRYIIIDNKKAYSLGGSIKDLPSGICSILEIHSKKMIEELNNYVNDAFK